MHHKYIFTLAGIFLVVALVVPIVTFALQADQDVDNILQHINNPSQGTGPNVTYINPDEVAENHYNTIIFVVAIEVVFVSLFIVMLYIGINHYHGQLDKPKKNEPTVD